MGVPPKKVDSALRRSSKDPNTFTEVFEVHFDAILRYVVQRTYDADLALDLTAETFAQGFLRRARFRGNSTAEERAWLYAIARAQLAMYFRRSRIERRAIERLEIEVPRLLTEQRQRIEDLANLDELRSLVRGELESLSSDQQAALQLRLIDELPYAEVAARLQISEEAARARVARGLKALAGALDSNPTLKEATQ